MQELITKLQWDSNFFGYQVGIANLSMDNLNIGIDCIIENYGIVPRDSTADEGFASIANQEFAKKTGIINIVFNKIVGKMQNIATSLNMVTRLKKWRSSSEAIISNFKRGFNIRVCNWKGWEHFQSKVKWSVMAYNIRVITSLFENRIMSELLNC